MAKAIEIEAARREVLARVRRPTAVEEVPLDAALGRRLAVDAIAEGPFQPFDNSAMDGFAVRAADVGEASAGSPVVLRVVDESRAGRPAERTLGGGEAIAISTGAMLPAGADAVVRVEDTEREGERVSVGVAVPPGANVRRAGEDIAAGEVVLRAGAQLGPAELGALATIGLDPAPVHCRPRVAILTSGDELTPPGEPLGPGAIRDSNSRTVPALATLAGAEVVSVDWMPDDPGGDAAALARALEADVAIVCGGVSVGEHDHVKAALADLGAEEVFWRVALKPGGPTWFGTRGETLVFGLPGNPVSVMVTFLTFVRPALIAMAGGDPAARRTIARLGADYEKPTDRAHAVRCRLELDERGWVAWPLPRQGSHILTSMLAADALALVPTESAGMAAGETVEVELLDRGIYHGPMTVTVRLFAVLRERAGRDSVEIELPEGATVADAFERLAAAPGLGELVERLPLRMAVNREYASAGDPIAPGDELALIPPISGGAPDGDPAQGSLSLVALWATKDRDPRRTRVRVTEESLDAGELSRWVGDPGAGGIVTFQGVTREVASLDYEAYREMAEARIAAILEDCARRHGLLAAAAEHRVGQVPRGEPGVVVAVSAGHREEAFAGAREAIDRIKAEAPIWKRELNAAGDGDWIEGAAAPEREASRQHEVAG